MYSSTQKYSSKKPRGRKQYLDENGVPPAYWPGGSRGVWWAGGVSDHPLLPGSQIRSPPCSVLQQQELASLQHASSLPSGVRLGSASGTY